MQDVRGKPVGSYPRNRPHSRHQLIAHSLRIALVPLLQPHPALLVSPSPYPWQQSIARLAGVLGIAGQLFPQNPVL